METRKNRIKIVCFKAMALFFGVSTGLVLFELMYRTFGPAPLYEQHGYVKTVLVDKVDGVELWDWGGGELKKARKNVIAASKDSESLIIVGLGDSIMFGSKLSSGQSPYIDLLSEKLAMILKRPVTVINLSVPGYNVAQEAAIFKKMGVLARPDIVIIHFWENDISPGIIINGYPVYASEPEKTGVLHTIPLPDNINGFLLLNSNIYQRLSLYALNQWGKNQSEDYMKSAHDYLAEIKKNADISSARVIILFSPYLDQGQIRPYKKKSLYATVAKWGKELGMETIDLGETFNGIEGSKIGIDSCHFNARGHHLIADELSKQLLIKYPEIKSKKNERKPRVES